MTAKSLLKDNFLLIENDKTCEYHTHLVVQQMIEFAKLHVEAALKQACFQMQLPEEDFDFLLNCYSLDNIK